MDVSPWIVLAAALVAFGVILLYKRRDDLSEVREEPFRALETVETTETDYAEMARQRQEEFDRLYAALRPLPAIDDLPPTSGHESPCLRCGSRATVIHHYSGLHKDCPDERLRTPWAHMLLGFGDLPSLEAMAVAQRHEDRAIQHHDRACFNCKFTWVEAVLPASK